MPKSSGKQATAKHREATKRGEISPVDAASLVADPTYVDQDNHPKTLKHSLDDLEPDFEAGPSKKVVREKVTRENRDLVHDRPLGTSASAISRNKNGKTIKGRAAKMQKSMASIFPIIPKLPMAKALSPEPDSNIEILNSFPSPVTENNPATLQTLDKDIELHPSPVEPVPQDDSELPNMTMDIFSEISSYIPAPTYSMPASLPTDPEFSIAPQISWCDQGLTTDVLPAAEPIIDPPHLTLGVIDTEPRQPGPEELLLTEGNDALDDFDDPADTESPELPAEIPGTGIESPQVLHDRLANLINKHLKEYRKPKVMISDRQAANWVFNLEALKKYNDLHLKHQKQIQTLEAKILAQPPRKRDLLRAEQRKIRPATDASLTISSAAGEGPYYARQLRKLGKFLLETGDIPESRRGKGAAHSSLLNIPEVSSHLRQWSNGVFSLAEGGFEGKIKPEKLLRYVNDFLLPQLKIQKTISVSTSARWLKKLGFSMRRVTKGIYVDGHERPDVVKARQEYINYMYHSVLPFCHTYEGVDMVPTAPVLEVGEKIYYPIYHDETCFHANDQSQFVWMREGEQPLRSKSRGRIVHVSDFIIEHDGRLCLSEVQIMEQMKLPIAPVVVEVNPAPAIPDPVTPLSQAVPIAGPAGATPANLPAAITPASVDASVPGNMPAKKTKKPKEKADPKPKKPKNTRVANDAGRTAAEHADMSSVPVSDGTKYRLSSFDARRIIHPGANYDPWWDMPQLIVQTRDAIRIFEVMHPDGVAVFIFDCSSAHEAFASDALLAHKMNRGPGGVQPKMHDTINPLTGELQTMVYALDYKGLDEQGKPLAGQAKGMERVLEEHGLLRTLETKKDRFVGVCGDCRKSQAARDKAAKEAKAREDEIEGSGVEALGTRGVSAMEEEDLDRSSTCCMQRVLSLQPDFLAEKPLLQIIIEKAGHKCLFLPKFHCELNPIEMVWGQAKQRFRQWADGTFPRAKDLVPECLDHVSTLNIRRYFRHCWRYLDAYKIGLNLRQAAFAVKKYTSHRRVPAMVFEDEGIKSRA